MLIYDSAAVPLYLTGICGMLPFLLQDCLCKIQFIVADCKETKLKILDVQFSFINRFRVASSMTSTPNSLARVSLEPGDVPATI